MRRNPALPSRQRGAVLYVALIFLVLLALIGTAGMQVSLMQERMSANYRATNMAFQRSEAIARNEEAEIITAMGATGTGTFVADRARCDVVVFNPAVWAETQSIAAMNGGLDNADDSLDGTISSTGRVDKCTPGGDISVGNTPQNEKTDLAYEISAFATDRAADPGGDAAIDTIFKP